MNTNKKLINKSRVNVYKCCICNISSKATINVKECPKCGATYWNKTKVENILLTLQDKFLENKDPKYLDEMAPVLLGLIRNIVVSKLKYTGKILSQERIEDLIMDTMCKLLMYYKKDFFKIEHSFTGYISYMVLYPLYNKKSQEKSTNEVSIFSSINNSDSCAITIEDMLSESFESKINSEEYLLNEWQKEEQVRVIIDYLDELFKVAVSTKGLHFGLYLMALIYNKINKDEKLFSSAISLYHNTELEDYFTKAWTLLRDFFMYEIKEGHYETQEEKEEFKKEKLRKQTQYTKLIKR